MSRINGAGPGSAAGRPARVVMVTFSSGVVAFETATQGVSGAMPEAMRSAESVSKSRPGM